MADPAPTGALTVDFAGLSGLEQLRLGLKGEAPMAPIARTVGFELIEVEEGHVVFEGLPTKAVYNPLGTVHGGWMATLLDSACGCAVHTMLKPGWNYTTLELYDAGTQDGLPQGAESRYPCARRRNHRPDGSPRRLLPG